MSLYSLFYEINIHGLFIIKKALIVATDCFSNYQFPNTVSRYYLAGSLALSIVEFSRFLPFFHDLGPLIYILYCNLIINVLC